jgi:hypothetical protein
MASPRRSAFPAAARWNGARRGRASGSP